MMRRANHPRQGILAVPTDHVLPEFVLLDQNRGDQTSQMPPRDEDLLVRVQRPQIPRDHERRLGLHRDESVPGPIPEFCVPESFPGPPETLRAELRVVEASPDTARVDEAPLPVSAVLHDIEDLHDTTLPEDQDFLHAPGIRVETDQLRDTGLRGILSPPEEELTLAWDVVQRCSSLCPAVALPIPRETIRNPFLCLRETTRKRPIVVMHRKCLRLREGIPELHIVTMSDEPHPVAVRGELDCRTLHRTAPEFEGRE